MPPESERHGGIPCPHCGCRERDVLETRFRKRTDSVYRRSVCRNCGERFSTQECLVGLPQPAVQAAKRSSLEAEVRFSRIEHNLQALKRLLS